MKRVLLVLILLFIFLLISYVNSLHVEWAFEPGETTGMESFRLYDSGNIIAASFTPESRIGDFDYDLQECTGFYMTAYAPNRESLVSNVFVMCPEEEIQFQAVGTLRIIRND